MWHRSIQNLFISILCIICSQLSRGTGNPVYYPTSDPTGKPSSRPTAYPTATFKPSPMPTSYPTGQPTSQPSRRPSTQPSVVPTGQPTRIPTALPSHPTYKPTRIPTQYPIIHPTAYPYSNPTRRPTYAPSSLSPLTPKPTAPTPIPTSRPSRIPTTIPTTRPTGIPTFRPSNPTYSPSAKPTTHLPTLNPTTTSSPTITKAPSNTPTSKPTRIPTIQPTKSPSRSPTFRPSLVPTYCPSSQPTLTSYPSTQPTVHPTGPPSSHPSGRPTAYPTISKQPTSHPSGRPSALPSTPSSQPTSQPTRQPSRQPSSQPTRQPSSQPTKTPNTELPTVKPTSKPTRAPDSPSSRPTSRPTGVPSRRPTGIPSVRPTISFDPTSPPSSRPSSHPTSKPSTSWGSSLAPTETYEAYNATGTVTFYPDTLKLCQDVEIDIYITIHRNISKGSRIYIRTPGITSGLCTSPVVGHNISTLLLYNNSVFSVKYVEGNYTNNFLNSFLIATITTDSFVHGETYRLLIDRGNGLKRSCLFNSTWDVDVRINRYRIYTGYLHVYETFPKLCFLYYSALDFIRPHQQYPTGINISIQAAFKFDNSTYFKITLPGFTNQVRNYPLNKLGYNTTDDDEILYYSQNASLVNIQYSTNYSWSGTWVEGNSTRAPVNASYLLLQPQGTQEFLIEFWVYIDRFGNHLLPLCGQRANYSGFQIELITSSADTYYTNSTSFTSTTAIGTGCSLLNNCNNNGDCDFCYSRCKCFDGFGSDTDKANTNADTFARDCSSRACPLGIARAINRDSYTGDMHRLVECANNGICNRNTGKCQCFDGYNGAACERRACPGTPTCSGQGQCLPMNVLAYRTDAYPLQNSSLSIYYEHRRISNGNYESWDSDISHQCVCDSSWAVGLGSNETQLAEYFGNACEFRRCPSGDDPGTSNIDETDCYGKAQVSGSGLGAYGNLCHIECSNRGICDYSIGTCSCFTGYIGSNCGTLAKYPGQLTGSRKYWPMRGSTNYTLIEL